MSVIADMPLTDRINSYEAEARQYLGDDVVVADIAPVLGTLMNVYCANPAPYSQPTYQYYGCPQNPGQCGCCTLYRDDCSKDAPSSV